MCRHRMRGPLLPSARAAATCSVSLMACAALWVIRAKPGMVLMPTATIRLTMLGPSALHHGDGEEEAGKREDDVHPAHEDLLRGSAPIGGGEAHDYARARRDDGGAQRHAEGDAGAVENARQDVAPQLVPTKAVAPRRRGQGAVELLLQGIVGRHPGPDDGHEEEEHDEGETGDGGAVAREAPPRRRGRSST